MSKLTRYLINDHHLISKHNQQVFFKKQLIFYQKMKNLISSIFYIFERKLVIADQREHQNLPDI